ncbi:MAG TPA: hypothetical protein PLD95_02930 [bacterium]|jgi:hypothetical protein|nr:hypothetical protein [bacterium]HOG38404.1 hypothetical protein [bacterium]HQI03362.1 hypothetical protein [bacterium]
MKHLKANNLVFYIFRIIISLIGVFIGTIIGLVLFYPMILAFPNNLLIVIIELYLVIFLSVGFYEIFSLAFTNYINYKPIFKNNGLKSFFQKKNFVLSFYVFGIMLFIFFILGF